MFQGKAAGLSLKQPGNPLNSVQRNVKGLSHSLTVVFICLHAVPDVAELDFFRNVSHGSGRILKEHLLLGRRHQAEQGTRLRIVVRVIFPVIPLISRTIQFQRRFLVFALLLPFSVAVGFIAQG